MTTPTPTPTPNHPAVREHLEYVQRTYSNYSLNVPNHDQLVAFLEKLPLSLKYKVLDGLVPMSSSELKLFKELNGLGNGELIEFGELIEIDDPNHLVSRYGCCEFLDHPRLPTQALRIFVNGFAYQKYPEYYVIPIE